MSPFDARHFGSEDEWRATTPDLTGVLLLEAASRGFYCDNPPEDGPVSWVCPSERAVILPGVARIPNQARRYARDFQVSFNYALPDVLRGCADMPRGGSNWIGPRYEVAVLTAPEGAAFSVEVWRSTVLAGGLFGFVTDTTLCWESMFHVLDNAGHIALAALCGFAHRFDRMIDLQDDAPWKQRYGSLTRPRNAYLHDLSPSGPVRPVEVVLPVSLESLLA